MLLVAEHGACTEGVEGTLAELPDRPRHRDTPRNTKIAGKAFESDVLLSLSRVCHRRRELRLLDRRSGEGVGQIENGS